MGQHVGEYTLDEVGAELGLTRERVRQVEQKALRKMVRAAYLDKGLDHAIDTLLYVVSGAGKRPEHYKQPERDFTRWNPSEIASNLKRLLVVHRATVQRAIRDVERAEEQAVWDLHQNRNTPEQIATTLRLPLPRVDEILRAWDLHPNHPSNVPPPIPVAKMSPVNLPGSRSARLRQSNDTGQAPKKAAKRGPTSKVDVDQLIADQASGLTYKELSAKHGISQSAICQKLKGANVTVVRKSPDVNQMIEYQNAGMSQGEIGRKLGVSQATVSQYLKKHRP